MNKKKFSRILSMYQDGVNERVCIESIMDMSTSHTQAATWIEKFYYETLLKPYTEDKNVKPLDQSTASNLENK